MEVTITEKGKQAVELFRYLDSIGDELTNAGDRFALVERLWPIAQMLGVDMIQVYKDSQTETTNGQT